MARHTPVRMRAAATLFVIGTALCFAASTAQAIGFGRIINVTQLGQPLNFAAIVHLEPDETLARECVSAEVASGDSKLQPSQMRVTLEPAADPADRTVRITTSALIDEPVVTVSVTLGCGSKITRRFVAFIDPPLINAAQTSPTEQLPPQRVDSQVSPIVTLVQNANGDAAANSSGGSAGRARRGADAASAPPRVRERRRVVAESVTASAPLASAVEAAPTKAAVPRPPRVPAVTRPVTVARAAPAGPRLQLEAAPSVLSGSASAAGVAAAVAPAATASAPPADDTAEQIARERQRIQMLEEGLAKLRADSQANQAALQALQLKLKDAEAGRYANPLVYALAWLSALLALAVAGLWWRQSGGRQPQWWSVPAPAETAARSSAPEPVPSAAQALDTTASAALPFEMSMVDDEPEPSAVVQVTTPAQFSATLAPPVEPEPPRELSVEELIDLEQQVEFFIVLGQDEAAIELLMSHVRSDGGISPLPYLKLLEIYRRRGDGDAYQRIRERFNRRFNAYAPDWEDDAKHGRELVDYPETLQRLQSLWSMPARVMETLDASLFRRNKVDETFDLPAYRELLFLYSIARDLAEHAPPAAARDVDVDFLLPLDDLPHEPIERLSATVPGEFRHSDLMTMPLDLDVSLDPEASGQSNFVDFDLNDGTTPKPPKPNTGGGR
jgi:pilus assembly protein FimV